jgi:hypothetical protein
MRARRLLTVVLLLVSARAVAQEQLSHKLLGTLGLDAGTQPESGLYATDRFTWYGANQLRDRNGRLLPTGVDIEAFANFFGVSASYELPRLSTFVSASFAVPVARATLRTDNPEATLDRAGLGDIYVQPLKLGWRLPHLDLVTGYAFYAPSRRFEPGSGSGVSRAQWSQEASLGGTLFFDRARTWQLSALASYEHNQRKIGVDITRGDSVQIQGGAGTKLWRVLRVGVTGYALWQVSDDRGAEVPPLVRGLRERAYGLGAEIDVTIPAVRTRLTVRYAHDLAVESRPQGQIVLVGVTVTCWRPPRPTLTGK